MRWGEILPNDHLILYADWPNVIHSEHGTWTFHLILYISIPHFYLHWVTNILAPRLIYWWLRYRDSFVWDFSLSGVPGNIDYNLVWISIDPTDKSRPKTEIQWLETVREAGGSVIHWMDVWSQALSSIVGHRKTSWRSTVLVAEQWWDHVWRLTVGVHPEIQRLQRLSQVSNVAPLAGDQ